MLDKEKLRERREKQAAESVNIWTSFLTGDEEATTPENKKDDNQTDKK